MKSKTIIAMAFLLLWMHCFVCAAEDPAAQIQIKSGVSFVVPLTDGTNAVARCEVIDGKARLTYIYDGKFVDLLLSAWDPTPNPNPNPNPQPNPQPVNPYQPSPEWKSYVQPLVSFKLERKDADSLAAFYSAIGGRVGDASGTISTSADLWQVLKTEGKALGLKGKYPKLPETMDKVLADSLTLEVYKLDKPRTAALFQTLAWAVFEAGGSK